MNPIKLTTHQRFATSLLLAAVFALAGCAKKTAKVTPPPPPPEPQPAPAVAAAPAPEQPKPTPAATPTPSPSDEDLFARNVKDVFFDYDKSSIRSDQVPVVTNNQTFLIGHPNIKVLVEGHCDDRGSEEYNLALGTSRAETVKQSLIQQGVTADRIRTTSYGKERPFCNEDNEACWQQNRVDHFAFDR